MQRLCPRPGGAEPARVRVLPVRTLTARCLVPSLSRPSQAGVRRLRAPKCRARHRAEPTWLALSGEPARREGPKETGDHDQGKVHERRRVRDHDRSGLRVQEYGAQAAGRDSPGSAGGRHRSRLRGARRHQGTVPPPRRTRPPSTGGLRGGGRRWLTTRDAQWRTGGARDLARLRLHPRSRGGLQ